MAEKKMEVVKKVKVAQARYFKIPPDLVKEMEEAAAKLTAAGAKTSFAAVCDVIGSSFSESVQGEILERYQGKIASIK